VIDLPLLERVRSLAFSFIRAGEQRQAPIGLGLGCFKIGNDLHIFSAGNKEKSLPLGQLCFKIRNDLHIGFAACGQNLI